VTTGESAPHDPDGPLVAGRYELGAVLGVGSSAVVRRGIDLEHNEAVAVKLFHPSASLYDRRQQRQEMSALSKLEHPGLVGLHDGGTEDGRPFVVTDLVEGPTLAERILTGPLSLDEVRTLGAQLADALVAVHAGGIVHRDLKPANILLEDGHRARLTDFGISRALESTAATTAGCVVGTAAYLAPEQVRGEEIGPHTDIYALGLVLLEALTARREYPGSAVESATARLYRTPAVPEDLPADLRELLLAMTDDDPLQRPTADEVAALLSRRSAAALVADAGGSTAPRWGRRNRHRRRVDRRLGVSLAAAAVLMLFVVVGVYSMFPTLSVRSSDARVPVRTVIELEPSSAPVQVQPVVDVPVSANRG
jgi:eukaryotic-like serine/threonine-protein kinase